MTRCRTQAAALHAALQTALSGDAAEAAFAVGDGRGRLRAPGVIELLPDHPQPGAAATVVSAGIHGDETAPIELLLALARRLDGGRVRLAAPVLLIIGHPAAIRAGRRYLGTNLNRLFRRQHGTPYTDHPPDHPEASRAAELMSAVDDFWIRHGRPCDYAAETSVGIPLHLDLHTAIRASRYPRFAVEPLTDTPTPAALWPALSAAGIQAVLQQQQHSWTFSHYSRHEHGVAAFTLELGRVAPFGANDLRLLMPMGGLLDARCSGRPPATAPVGQMTYFRVDRELLRGHGAFSLTFPADVPNFTRFESGQTIAFDAELGDTVVRDGPLYVVFPNAQVEPGARAVLLVRPAPLPTSG